MELEQHIITALLGVISSLLIASIAGIAKLFITVNTLSIKLEANIERLNEFRDKDGYNDFISNMERYTSNHKQLERR